MKNFACMVFIIICLPSLGSGSPKKPHMENFKYMSTILSKNDMICPPQLHSHCFMRADHDCHHHKQCGPSELCCNIACTYTCTTGVPKSAIAAEKKRKENLIFMFIKSLLMNNLPTRTKHSKTIVTKSMEISTTTTTSEIPTITDQPITSTTITTEWTPTTPSTSSSTTDTMSTTYSTPQHRRRIRKSRTRKAGEFLRNNVANFMIARIAKSSMTMVHKSQLLAFKMPLLTTNAHRRRKKRSKSKFHYLQPDVLPTTYAYHFNAMDVFEEDELTTVRYKHRLYMRGKRYNKFLNVFTKKLTTTKRYLTPRNRSNKRPKIVARVKEIIPRKVLVVEKSGLTPVSQNITCIFNPHLIQSSEVKCTPWTRQSASSFQDFESSTSLIYNVTETGEYKHSHTNAGVTDNLSDVRETPTETMVSEEVDDGEEEVTTQRRRRRKRRRRKTTTEESTPKETTEDYY